MTIKRKELLIDFVAGLMIVVFCFYTSNPEYSLVHRILDGCFIAAIMLMGVGTLFFCANKGAFNIFGYAGRIGLSFLLPGIKNPWRDGDRESYYDYCMRKAEKEPKSFLPLLITGGVYLLISIVLLVIYLNT